MDDLTESELLTPPSPAQEVSADIAENSEPQELQKLPKECRDLIIEYLDTIDLCASRCVSRFWRDTIDSDPHYWRILDLRPYSNKCVPESVIERAICKANGTITNVILPLNSPLQDVHPLFNNMLLANRGSITSMEIMEADMMGDLILTHLPYMVNLISLRLTGPNFFLLMSNPKDKEHILTPDDPLPEQPAKLTLPPSLQELEIYTLGYPRTTTPWTITGSLVRLRLECASQRTWGVATLDLFVLKPLAGTLKELSVKKSVIMSRRDANGEVQLNEFRLLEKLEVNGGVWTADGSLPESIRCLSVDLGQVQKTRVRHWLASSLPSLEWFSARAVDSFSFAILREPLLWSTEVLRGLELIWYEPFILYDNPGLIAALESLLLRHGPTLEVLVFDCQDLPTRILETILEHCKSLVELKMNSERIDWQFIAGIADKIKQTGSRLKKLSLIYWSEEVAISEKSRILAELDDLGIQHKIEAGDKESDHWADGLRKWGKIVPT